MHEVDLNGLIAQAVARFAQNRAGPRPSVRAKLPPALPVISWRDESLGRLIKRFLYHALTANHPDIPVRVSVNERRRLADLEAFVRLHPLSWIQLRIEGHGAGMSDGLVEELFRDFAYRCEEWVGVEGSDAQLAIFTAVDGCGSKIIFCADIAKPAWKCDLLIPVPEPLILPAPSPRKKN
ncbi:MAG TPA: hypothetical protein VI231_01150 [Candidatus Binatia bacterium]|jgi:hypothetical protein